MWKLEPRLCLLCEAVHLWFKHIYLFLIYINYGNMSVKVLMNAGDFEVELVESGTCSCECETPPLTPRPPEDEVGAPCLGYSCC